MTDVIPLLKALRELSSEASCLENIKAREAIEYAVFAIEARKWRREDQGVDEDGDHDVEAPVPFNVAEACYGKREATGELIINIPTLRIGEWYRHDMKERITSPAAFLDPETKLDWYSRDEGKIEGTKIADIDWKNCKEYRIHQSLDDCVDALGLF